MVTNRPRAATLLAAALLLAACGAQEGPPADRGAAPATGGTPFAGGAPGNGGRVGAPEGERVFVFAAGGDAVGLDPAHVDDGESLKVCDSIYDTLVQFKPGTTEIEPALATSWETSPDGLTWTFHLREGVRFHDGMPFDAEAVLFSLLRQHDPAHPHHGVGGAYKYWGGMGMSDIVDTITAHGPLTVVFRLKVPEAPFLANLAMNFSSVVSPCAAKAAGERFSHAPVGTGSFRFARWDQNQRIVLEANADYWGGPPRLDRVIFEVVPDKNVRTLRFQSKEVHAFDNPGPTEIQAAKAMPHARILEAPGMNVGYLAMNTRRKPFGDTRVRLAVNHAVDKARIVRDVYKGTGLVAKNPLPPTLWGYNDAILDFAFDPARAKALLAEAGFPDGFKCTLWYMPVARPYMPDGKKVAESILLDLKAVGITAELVTYDWAKYLEGVNHGQHDMALLGWSGDNGDPDNFLNVLLSIGATEIPAQNIAFYTNAEFDRRIRDAKRTLDHAQRVALYLEAQEVFHGDPPWVCLAHNLQTVVIREDVQGMVLYPTTRKDFRRVTIGG